MTTVTRGTGPRQPGGPGSTENALIAGLLLVTVLSIGALLCIVLSSAEERATSLRWRFPPSAACLAAIGAIAVVLRRRPPRGRR